MSGLTFTPVHKSGHKSVRLYSLIGALFLISACVPQKKHTITVNSHTNATLKQAKAIDMDSKNNQESTKLEYVELVPTASVDPLLVGITTEDIAMSKAQAKRNFQRSWKAIGTRSRFVRQRLLASLKKLNAPIALQVLPAVESTYDTYALSPAGALGLWQLMPRTAHVLGVRSGKKVNGRRNISDATSAAVRYLQRMHKRFNNWPLAIAAYNMGPYAVARRLKKHGWKSADGLENMPIPVATRAYVQHVIGLAALLNDHEFTFPKPIKTRELEIQAPVDIERLAQISGMKKDDIFRFNPSLNQAQYLRQTITIHVPVSYFESMQNNAALAGPSYVKQTIKDGDNLWDLARSHNTSVKTLKSLNRGLGKYLRIGQHVRVPANRLAQAVADQNPLLAGDHRIRYKVRSGDSLWRIANQFGTTPKAIARSNQITMKHILRAGDILWVFAKVRPS